MTKPRDDAPVPVDDDEYANGSEAGGGSVPLLRGAMPLVVRCPKCDVELRPGDVVLRFDLAPPATRAQRVSGFVCDCGEYYVQGPVARMAHARAFAVAPPGLAIAYSKAELLAIVDVLRRLNEEIYWRLFAAGVGSNCHAFLEFCGLMSKYENLCRAAAEREIQFPLANTHSGIALPVEAHDVDYLAEKWDCIFGPTFRANPELAKRFAEKALGLKVD